MYVFVFDPVVAGADYDPVEDLRKRCRPKFRRSTSGCAPSPRVERMGLASCADIALELQIETAVEPLRRLIERLPRSLKMR